MSYKTYQIYLLDGSYCVSWIGPNGMTYQAPGFANIEAAQRWCDVADAGEAEGQRILASEK